MSRLPLGKAVTVPGGAPPMSPDTARRLAALIVADAQQLAERAGDHGVTAFVGRAVQRERPNERFLQNTLRNLASSNKRAEERAMWAARQAQEQEQREARAHRRGLAPERDSSRQQERRRSRSRQRSRQRRSRSRSRSWDERSRHRRGSRSRSSSSCSRSRERSASHDSDPAAAGAAAAACDAAHGPAATGSGIAGNHGSASEGDDAAAAADEQLRQWLAQSGRVRGRGSSGPNVDLTGPYLPAPAHPEASAVPRGPARPAWLPGEAEGQRRLAPNAGFLRGVLRTQGLAVPGGGSARLTSSSSDSDSSSSDGSSKRKRRRHKSSKKKSSSKKGSRKHSSKKRHKRKSKHRSRDRS